MQDVQEVEAAAREGRDPPSEALRAVLLTATGAQLYRPEGIRLQYVDFVRSIGKQIEALEWHRYDLDELQSFKQVMQAEAKEMARLSPAFGRK
eukprot:4900014-Lingulodinium_polyedra.AAC.1